MEVEYREIPGYPGYRVGDDGSVWSCRKSSGSKCWRQGLRGSPNWKLLSVFFNGDGYACIRTNPDRKMHRVHRLVLLSFVGPCPVGMEARHLNGISSDSSRINLEWATPKVNQSDRLLHGTDIRGSKNVKAKLSEDNVRQIKIDFRSGKATQKGLAKQYGVVASIVNEICNGKRWKHVE